MPTTKTLGDRIRELREGKDLSLREFGKKLGVSAAFLSDVELGRRHPSEKVLGDMARALGTSMNDLQSFDVRPTVQQLKRMVTENPALGFAFRRALDKEVSPEDLIKILDKQPDRKKS